MAVSVTLHRTISICSIYIPPRSKIVEKDLDEIVNQLCNCVDIETSVKAKRPHRVRVYYTEVVLLVFPFMRENRSLRGNFHPEKICSNNYVHLRFLLPFACSIEAQRGDLSDY